MTTTLIVIVIFAIIAKMLGSPSAKGKRGEAAVKAALFLRLPSDYSVLHNVTLPTPDGTTQIDHIVISRFGIFCIETKHMKGWIYGDAKQKSWTQVIYKKKTRFQNPLRQNYKHTETLRGLLNLPKESVYSVIVFTGEAALKTPMPANVGSTRKCLSYIKGCKFPIFSQAETDRIHQAIQSDRLEANRATDRLHVQHLKHGKREVPYTPRVPDDVHYSPLVPDDVDYSPLVPYEEEFSPDPCPKCGATLVLRTARKGPNAGNPFYGCSTFPKCRYTKNLA